MTSAFQKASWGQRTEIACAGHADWTRGGSRISMGGQPALRGGCAVERALFVELVDAVGRGERDMGGQATAWRAWQPKHRMAAGVKPRSREAVRVFAQGFIRDDSPGEDGWWLRASELAVAV
jgi:hypothetical protein